jgi:transposase
MAHSVIFAGLDVHAAQTHAAQLEAATGELSVTRLAGGSAPVVAWLRRLGPGVRAVYEAGPTGFGLARAAREQGIDLRVTTPGLVPKRPTDRVTTDRRDAVRLARLLAAGELSFARVPTVAEEQFRDLIRARDDVRGDLMRARHRLSKLLLRRELVYPGPGRAWTRAHLAWLARLTFDDAASTVTMTDYLAAVTALVQRRGTLDTAIAELVADSPYAATVPVLRCFRGIDTLSAAGLCAEIGDFSRFAHPRLLSGFLGIVPSEHTSDDKRRQGAITKAGPAHARRLLVEAAHHSRRPHASASLWHAGRPIRTHGCAPSRGAPSSGCTANGNACTASDVNRPASSRSRALENCPRSSARLNRTGFVGGSGYWFPTSSWSVLGA